MKPLLYLELRTFVNAIKSTVRTPKRLIPALFVAAGLFSCIVQAILFSMFPLRLGHGARIPAAAVPTETIQAIAFLLLSMGSVIIIYQAFSSGSLVFSIAHIDFLFPTPIPRRAVLLNKLIKDYLKYLAWVVFFISIFGGQVCMAMGVGLFPLGFISAIALTGYLLLITNLAHTMNIVFTFGYERLRQAGLAIRVVLVMALMSAVVFGAQHYTLTGNPLFALQEAVSSPLMKTIFAPADWCATIVLVPLKGSVDAFERTHLAYIWILAFLSFVLLMSRKENIYEPSIGISLKASKRRMAMRSGDATAYRVEMMKDKGTKRAGPLSIPPFGRGAVALIWKTMLTRYRMSWSQFAAVLIMPGVVFYVIRHALPPNDFLQYLPFVLIYVSFIMSMTVQPQVRGELKYANILKSMPIAAWKVMLVQALNGAIYLSMGILVFAGAMWALIPATRTERLAACTIGTPFLGFACISAMMIPALIYPDTKDSAQNFMANLVGMMLNFAAVIPTIVIGLVMLLLLNTSYYVALIPICVVDIIIGAAGVAVCGFIFRRFDPTSD